MSERTGGQHGWAGYREVVWNPESVRRFWNFYGDNAPAEQSFFARKFARRIVGMAERYGRLDDPVIDVGCGPGFLCEELLRRGQRVGGVDSSRRNVERVHERLGGRDGFLGAAVAEGGALPLADGQAGTLFLIEVLEHLPAGSRQYLLAELRRVLRPGGLLVVTTPNEEDLDAKKIACPECGCVFHRVQHLESIDARLMSDLLGQHGFEPRHVEAVNFRYFPDLPVGRIVAGLAARFPTLGGPPRHLAVFIRSLDGGGGAERMIVTLAGLFAERGHRVDLVLGRRGGSFLEAVPDAVNVVDLGGGSWPATIGLVLGDLRRAPALFPFHPPWILSCAPALVGYLRSQRPDAMLSALNYTNLTAVWARRLARAPGRLVLSERNTLSLRAARGPRRLRSLPRKVRRFYRDADSLVAVSDGVAEDLCTVMGLPRSAVRTIYNPVVTGDIAAQARVPVEHPWFAPGQPPVVLAVGKLRPQKGFRVLLDAFARLRARRPARLMLLGEGRGRAGLEQQVSALGLERDVALPGFEKNPFRFMARSAVFALSSEWEGLPAVLIQAMACGCPVVATNCQSGPAEILEDGAYGPLVPVGDADALAAGLAAVLGAPLPREKLVERAGFFSAEASARQYLELLVGETPSASGDRRTKSV